MAFTFNETEEPEVTTPFTFVDSTTRPVSPDQASGITEKLDFALDDLSPGRDTIFQEVIAGRRNDLAESMTHLEVMKRNSMKQQQLFDFASKAKEEGRPIDDVEFEQLLTKGDAEFNDLIKNPDTYFEKRRAKTTVDTLVPPEAQPSEAEGVVVKKFLAKQYGLQRILEETKARQADESTLSNVVNFA